MRDAGFSGLDPLDLLPPSSAAVYFTRSVVVVEELHRRICSLLVADLLELPLTREGREGEPPPSTSCCSSREDRRRRVRSAVVVEGDTAAAAVVPPSRRVSRFLAEEKNPRAADHCKNGEPAGELWTTVKIQCSITPTVK
nr:stigma-specific STIG1-like protein 1 [Ipomoea batatas]